MIDRYMYMYILVHAQVIQNCTTLSCVDIYNMDGKHSWKRCFLPPSTLMGSFHTDTVLLKKSVK